MMTGAEVAQQARTQLTQLTGLVADTLSSLDKGEDGWHVSVEMIELKRIPEASDVLASYAAVLDDEGRLVRYQRGRRYCRSQTTEGE